MSNGYAVLDTAKDLLWDFAKDNTLVSECTITQGKNVGPGHKVHPSAFRTRVGDFTITVHPHHVLVGVRRRGVAFTCRLDTKEPNQVKSDLVKYLAWNA